MNRWVIVTALALLPFGIENAPASAAEFPLELAAALQLAPEEAERLEALLETDPDHVQARSKLVVYYFQQAILDPAVRRTRNQHLLWLIRNAPQADVLSTPHAQIQPFQDRASYDAGKSAWLSYIEREPSNVTFVCHAANFFSPLADLELHMETLLKAQALDPDNYHWPFVLGQQYLRDAMFNEDPSAAVLALEQFERAYEVAASDLERSFQLVSLAKSAFLAERHDDASAYATTMLEDAPGGWDEGNQLHHGNLILGRIALLEDDVEAAKRHLLQAGKVSGSPQLGSFGPNMRLAADLLERGEREVVLEYFRLCANFWPRDELKDWAALVEAGEAPDFGANLVY